MTHLLMQHRWIDHAKRVARRLHEDEGGAEALEKLLIIAAIVLPLLALLIVFRGSISEWVKGGWNSVKGDAQNYDPNLP